MLLDVLWEGLKTIPRIFYVLLVPQKIRHRIWKKRRMREGKGLQSPRSAK